MNFDLENEVNRIKSMSVEELTKEFNCEEKDIYFGNFRASDPEHIHLTVCPYKVILGSANFEGSNITSLGNLEVVVGKKMVDNFGAIYRKAHRVDPAYLGISIKRTKITDLGNLKKVYGSVTLNPYITSMRNVEFLGSNLYLNNTNVKDLGNIKTICGKLCLADDANICGIKTLGNLEKVGSIYLDSETLSSFGNLQEIEKFEIKQFAEKDLKNDKFFLRIKKILNTEKKFKSQFVWSSEEGKYFRKLEKNAEQENITNNKEDQLIYPKFNQDREYAL